MARTIRSNGTDDFSFGISAPKRVLNKRFRHQTRHALRFGGELPVFERQVERSAH